MGNLLPVLRLDLSIGVDANKDAVSCVVKRSYDNQR